MKAGLTPEQVRERYNRQADAYQSRYTGLKGDYYRSFEDHLFLGHLAVRDKRVLDLGTGRGRLALMLAAEAREVIGIDISEEMLRFAREAGEGVPNVRFELGNALQLDYPDRYFDVVSSMGMFPYVRELGPFLREINRVLQPGGQLAFSVVNADEWKHTEKFYGEARRWFDQARGKSVSPPLESPLIAHERSALEAELESAGFALEDYRSTFFFGPSRVFYWAGRRGLRPLQSLAVSINHALGRAPVMREHGKVMVLFARKTR